MKQPVITRDDYAVFLEYVTEKLTFVHCDVYRWTPRTRRQLTEDFDAFCREWERPIMAAHYPEQGEKHRKFLRMFDFAYLCDGEDARGRPCEIHGRMKYG